MSITGRVRTRTVSKSYPVTSGTTIETTKIDGRQVNLVAEKGSLVPKREQVGME